MPKSILISRRATRKRKFVSVILSTRLEMSSQKYKKRLREPRQKSKKTSKSLTILLS